MMLTLVIKWVYINVKPSDAINMSTHKNFQSIQDFVAENGKAFIFLGEGQHKIKRKAEQIACNMALQVICINDEYVNNSEENFAHVK